MVESGLILKWYKDNLPPDNKCRKSLSSIHHNQTTLENTKRAFVVLSIGIAAATVALLLEIAFVKLRRSSSKTLQNHF